MASNQSGIPIRSEELEKFTKKVNLILKNISWSASAKRETDPGRKALDLSWSQSSQASERSNSIIDIAKDLDPNKLILSDEVNHCLNVVMEGLKIGLWFAGNYTSSSGLEILAKEGGANQLSPTQSTEFREKKITSSAITLYTTAYYIIDKLSSYKSDEIGSVILKFDGVGEVHLSNSIKAIDCLVFYYGESLKTVNTGLAFIKMTLLYFNAIIEQIKLREDSLKYTNFFADKTFQTEKDDFSITGFAHPRDKSELSVEFNRIESHQIVGNRDAKHKSDRLARIYANYDIERQRNPFLELGGIPSINMGHGFPGTGKSMIISLRATLMHDYCQRRGIPFLFCPIPKNVISKMQGESAERTEDWFNKIDDPTKVVYAPIDDAENLLSDVDNENVSEGNRQVRGVFLPRTEGASANLHGNRLIDIMTNNPHLIDTAILSRIIEKVEIPGAVTVEDVLDQYYLWYKRYQDIAPTFVNLTNPVYDFLSAQKELKSLSEVYEEIHEPKDYRLNKIFCEVRDKYPITSHEFYAQFNIRIKNEIMPKFTSRDMRNIHSIIDARLMDFDIPDEWFDNHALFFEKSYEERVEILRGLLRENMKGHSFQEILLQETIRYLDNLIQILDKEFEKKVEDLIEHSKVRNEAERRLLAV